MQFQYVSLEGERVRMFACVQCVQCVQCVHVCIRAYLYALCMPATE